MLRFGSLFLTRTAWNCQREPVRGQVRVNQQQEAVGQFLVHGLPDVYRDKILVRDRNMDDEDDDMENFVPGLRGPKVAAAPANDTILFFGAGASVAAGVPDTKSFVEAFRKSLAGEPEVLADLDGLLKLLGQDQQQADIEALLEALDYLDPDARSRIPALAVAKPSFKFTKTSAAALRRKLHELIVRKAVVQSSDIGYLEPLLDFFQTEGPLDLFSVNYDTCVELLCHTRRIKFTDGFGVEWLPSEFQRDDIQLRLIKLHGSVLWYETSTGACIRVPVVPEGGEHTLFTHEKAQPLMLYPARKWAYAEPLLHNLELFRTRLSHSSTRNIIVVGYSFRDEHLRRIFFDALRSNLDARIVLIAPNAWEIYQHRLEYSDDAKSIPSPARNRVVCLPYGFQDALPLLKGKLSVLPSYTAVHGRASYDWGLTLENALKSEDIASAIAVAPRVNWSYFTSDGTKRAIRAYVIICLLEAAQHRSLLQSFPGVEERVRQILGHIRLDVNSPRDTNYRFKLDARTIKRDDGTSEQIQAIDIYEIKDAIDWLLRDYDPLLRAGNATEAPVVKRFKALRDRLAAMARSPLSEYEKLTLPLFSAKADQQRFAPEIGPAVTLVKVSTGDDKLAEGSEQLCKVERAILFELMGLPDLPVAAARVSEANPT